MKNINTHNAMKKILVILFLILCQNNFSQNSNIKRFYEVDFGGKPQTITLIEYKNGKVKGFLKTKLIIKEQDREIVRKKRFSHIQVKKMLTDLKNAGIETLKNCNEDIDCESLAFLDGDSLEFNILVDGTNKQTYYSGIYPESQTNGKLEEIELRKKAQLLATIIDKEINLNKQFSDLLKNLEKREYCYWQGAIAKVCMYNK